MSTSLHKVLTVLVFVLVLSLTCVESDSGKTKKSVKALLTSLQKTLSDLLVVLKNVLQELLRFLGLAPESTDNKEDKPTTTATDPTSTDPATTTSTTAAPPAVRRMTDEADGVARSRNTTKTTVSDEKCIPWKVSGCSLEKSANGTGCCDNGPNRPNLECQESPNGRDAACVKQCLEIGDQCPFALDNGGCCGSNEGFSQLRCAEDPTMTDPIEKQNFGRCVAAPPA